MLKYTYTGKRNSINNLFKGLILLLFTFAHFSVSSQIKRHEIGVFAGAAYYMGDLNSNKLFHMSSPVLGFLYRYDFNLRYAMKINANFATLHGDDSKSDNLYQQQRNHNFSTRIREVSAMFEFNFLPFQAASKNEYYSLYVTAGVGSFFMKSPSNFPIHPIIPFGLGFKYGINKRIVVATEWTYRKTFTDYIDKLLPEEYGITGSLPAKQLSYNNSKDWYSFAGISFTYKFALGSISCPAYGKLSK